MTSVSAAPGIVARDVRKSFGDHVVLDNVSLAVEEGTILALLGPNGAGKTTMVRILSTLIPADSGSVGIAGHDVVSDADGVRAIIGVTGQFSAVDNLLTGAENLRLMADLRHLGREVGQRRVTELLEQFDLTGATDKLLSTYSGGMRRRLDLAMTLVGEPRVIFLDEPTTGLDPRSRLTMWEIVRKLASDGVTILLTTQYLDEADHLASRIVIIDRGRVVADGTPAELKQRAGRNVVEVHVRDRRDLAAVAAILSQMSRPGDTPPVIDETTRRVTSDVEVGMGRLMSALQSLNAGGLEIEDLAIRQPKLDEVFLALTGQPLEGEAADPTAA
jgi:ABC-2 type transport system ATP-binding protein